MVIGGKSALLESQWRDRKEKGIKFIELHPTLDDLKNLNETLEKKYAIKHYGLTPYAVHVPIYNSFHQECVLGEPHAPFRKENLDLIKKSIILADKLCDAPNPIVILSLGGWKEGEGSFDLIRDKKDVFQKDLAELLKYTKERYSKVVLGIKNSPKVKRENGRDFYSFYGDEYDFIKWIRDLNNANVGIVLDTSNALRTIDYNREHNEDSDFTSIEAFLDSYIPYLKMIHLSNREGFEVYGLPFLSSQKEDRLFLKQFFTKLIQLKYHYPITIETNELDDNNAINWVKTKDAITESFKK